MASGSMGGDYERAQFFTNQACISSAPIWIPKVKLNTQIKLDPGQTVAGSMGAASVLAPGRVRGAGIGPSCLTVR